MSKVNGELEEKEFKFWSCEFDSAQDVISLLVRGDVGQNDKVVKYFVE